MRVRINEKKRGRKPIGKRFPRNVQLPVTSFISCRWMVTPFSRVKLRLSLFDSVTRTFTREVGRNGFKSLARPINRATVKF